MKEIQKIGSGRNVEVDKFWIFLLDGFGMSIGLQITFRLRLSPAISSRAKSGPQIAHQVNFPRLLIISLADLVVLVFQIPAIHQRHHDAESVKLSGSAERIVSPLPPAGLLVILEVTLQPNILNCPVSMNEVLTTLQVGRYTFHLQPWYEVIFIGVVADCPKQVSGGGLGPGLRSHFRRPLCALVVTHIELRI